MQRIMDFSCENILKYAKLVIVHPAVEITIGIIYLVTSILIAILIFKESSQYDEHQILDITESYLNYNNFNQIKSPNQFKSYLISILDKLYILNPSTEEIPLFIPLNPIRLNFFLKENECNIKIDYTKSCINELNKFKCAIDNMLNSFKYKCGEKFEDENKFFVKNLKGYYSWYNLRNKNHKNLDITRQTYYARYQNDVNDLIDDKQLKAIVLQINLKAPSINSYVDVVLGLEMTNYFTNVKTIFSVYTINHDRPSTNTVLYVSLIFLIISIFLSFLKLIYEMNVKCIYSIHLVTFLVKLMDIFFVINCIVYLAEDKRLKFDINLNEFESHIKYINIIWYLKIFFGIMSLYLPFRLLSLLSWLKIIVEPLIVIMNVIFRMLPGLIISLIDMIFFSFIFSIINYFLFNDTFSYYETMAQSFISSFNINIISSIYNPKIPSKIYNNLFISKYSIFFLYFQTISFFFISSIFIATLVYMFKNAISLEEPDDKDGYLEKLNEIENKIQEDKNKEYNDEPGDLQRKQILWFSLDKDKVKLGNNINNENYDILFFKNSEQILSFLKYLFSMKPGLQHKKLRYKLNIIIEINQKNLDSIAKKEINRLTDWLIFIECKIPLIFYGITRFETSYKAKLKSLYKFSIFVNSKKELEKILKINEEKNMVITSNEQFTIVGGEN